MPWYAKLLAAGVVAYALNPIDLIPDFIPVLGYLDDIVLVPLGISLVIRCIPSCVLSDLRAAAEHRTVSRHGGRSAAVVIVALWLTGAVAVVSLVRS